MFGSLKPYVPWLITSLLALGLIFSNDTPQVEALRANLSDLVVIMTHPVSAVLKAPRLWDENVYLRERLAEMSLKFARLGSSGEECERLRSMLAFKEKTSYSLIAGDMVGMNPDIGIRGLLLNVGSDDGVKINQAVIVPDGLVGRIYRVGKRSSNVQLLTDKNIGIAGRLLRNQEDGIVHASVGSSLRLDGIPVTAAVSEGDSVVTSGLGGVFPPGLFIGLTDKVERAPNGWLWRIEVEPAVDFGRLAELFVIQNADSTR